MRILTEDGIVRVWGNFEGSCELRMIRADEELRCWQICLKRVEEKKRDKRLLLVFSFPSADICGRWHPLCGFDRSLKADYEPALETMTARSAPVLCFFSGNGENRCTIALSEVRQRVILRCGLHEEDGNINCRIEIPLMNKEGEDYQTYLWLNRARRPYWETLDEVRAWWEDVLALRPLEVPEEGRMPHYSSWYSRHQEVTAEIMERDGRLAAELGLRGAILDDGWQTLDNSRGYAFCGDWKPCREKFPDFAAHVERMHKLGLNYLAWFSVPYIGKQSDVWERFKDMLLRYDEGQQAGILDLRYPEVREYLKQIYIRAVGEWGLDGLKLDFIDEFYLPWDESKREGMDVSDLQEALNIFLEDVTDSLRRLKPDILIEFRQRYIGPQIRGYGNLFRVSDCPGSAVSNRVGTINLRLLSGNTAVHSDMLMWHPGEKPEEAALQLISCLFSTVQISVRPEALPEDMKRMLRFWISFMKKHVELLQKRMIQPLEPQNLFPEVRAETKEEKVIVHYSGGRIADLRGMPGELYYIHGFGEEDVCFRKEGQMRPRYQILDCFGEIREEGIMEEGQWAALRVPTSGMVQIKRQ